jgi:ABC-2 type transport system ATP-binding protein
MAVVEVRDLSYCYGRQTVLQDLDLAIEAGSLYALLGPNGAGKTTLLQILMGLRRPVSGSARLLGRESASLSLMERSTISYVAEGQSLPTWMRLSQLEAYLAPLYHGWDTTLATTLRERFTLDPQRKIGAMSRGEQMKAALLCALAPRPKLLVMDEPFTGMDAIVKDELVRGLLESAGSEGWTILLCSHDIGELEMLADHVGILHHGRMIVSETMDELRARFKRVTIQLPSDSVALPSIQDESWLGVDRAARRVEFLTSRLSPRPLAATLRDRFQDAERIDIEDASLREVFVGLVKSSVTRTGREEAA